MLRLQRARAATSARWTSCRARATAGSAAAAGPDAAEVAQRRLDRGLGAVERVDQLRRRSCGSARTRTSRELLDRVSAACGARGSRAAGCLRDAVRALSGLLHAVGERAGSAARRRSCRRAIWPEPVAACPRPAVSVARARRRPLEPAVERARRRAAAARGRARAGSAAGRPRRSDASAAAARRCARAARPGPARPRRPAAARPRSWKRFRRRSRASVVIGPLGLEGDLERRRPARAAIALERLVALARRVVGRQVRDVRRPGVERQRRGGQQQQREASSSSTATPGLRDSALGQPHPRVLAARRPQLPAVDVGAEQREPGRDREQRGARRPARRRRSRPASPTRAARPARSKSAPSIPTASAVPGEHHRAPGARDRLLDGLRDAAPGGQLLPEARDDQQRVVDAEREADHRQHVERQRVELRSGR